MINSILIKNVASFEGETRIKDLKKANFFFGSNGCGKTTIARTIYNDRLPQNHKNDDFAECSIQKGAHDDSLILVYDDNFVERNFYKQEDLSGIFSLDEQNKDIDYKIEVEEKKVAQNNEAIQNREQEKQALFVQKDSLKKEIQEKCWSLRDIFSPKKGFHQISLEHTGSKLKHFQKLCSLIKDNSLKEPDLIDIKERYNKYYGKEITAIDCRIPIRELDEIINLETEISAALSEVVVGNKDVSISHLIEELQNSDWVRRGQKYLTGEKNEPCPFCQRPLDDNFHQILEKYFDKSFEIKQDQIESYKKAYDRISNSLFSEIRQLGKEFDENSIVTNFLRDLNRIVRNNKENIDKKLEAMNEKKEIKSISSVLEKANEINNIISKHNEDVKNLRANRNKVHSDIWNYMACQAQRAIEKYRQEDKRIDNKISVINSTIESLANQVNESKRKIEHLQNKTINTQKAVDQINNILKRSGFVGFEIAKKEIPEKKITRYFLKRDNNNYNGIFKTLSEGEKNFIAFLYFYQLCLGTVRQTDARKNKIIVIDDPVSSMDSQVLFIVSTLIRNLLKHGQQKDRFANESIEQIFILTHNIYFYKEVSFCKGSYYIINSQAHFYVKKINKKTIIDAPQKRCFINNDYELLWIEACNLNNSRISLLNTLRRIIESYSNFIGLGDDVWNSIKHVDENSDNYFLYRALLSNLNDGSHKVAANDDMYFSRVEASYSNEQIMKAFELLFKELNGGELHYQMMIDHCKSNT